MKTSNGMRQNYLNIKLSWSENQYTLKNVEENSENWPNLPLFKKNIELWKICKYFRHFSCPSILSFPATIFTFPSLIRQWIFKGKAMSFPLNKGKNKLDWNEKL